MSTSELGRGGWGGGGTDRSYTHKHSMEDFQSKCKCHHRPVPLGLSVCYALLGSNIIACKDVGLQRNLIWDGAGV